MNRWLCVLGGILMNISLGAVYGWSLFVPALQKDLNLSREQASNIFSIAIAMVAIGFLIGGRIQDKKGPYPVSLTGGLLFGLGFVLTSRVTNLNEIYLSFGVVAGLGTGLAYVTPIAVVSKWFPDKRGLVVGLGVAAFGAASAILGFIVPDLISAHGWQKVMLWLGFVYWGCTLVAAHLLKNPPQGWKPEGWNPTAAANRVGADMTPREMLGTSQFWRLLVGYSFGISAGLMVISQLAPYVRQALPEAGSKIAGSALIVGALGNTLGRIFSGWMSDTVGRVKTLSVMVLISAITLPLLGRTSSVALIWPLLVAVYYCYGTQLSVYASTTADFFGTKNVGANYGLVFLAFGIAGIVGPKLGGRVYDQFQSYTRAFDIAAVLLLVAFAAIVTLKPPQLVREREASATIGSAKV